MEEAHDYGTNFGEEQTCTVSSVAMFSMGIYRHTSFFLWKLLLSLIIMVLAAVLARPMHRILSMPGWRCRSVHWFRRFSCRRAILTPCPTWAIHMSMDKIYLQAYLLVLVVLVRVILGYLQLERQGGGGGVGHGAPRRRAAAGGAGGGVLDRHMADHCAALSTAALGTAMLSSIIIN
jgi:hypothetical protein